MNNGILMFVGVMVVLHLLIFWFMDGGNFSFRRWSKNIMFWVLMFIVIVLTFNFLVWFSAYSRSTSSASRINEQEKKEEKKTIKSKKRNERLKGINGLFRQKKKIQRKRRRTKKRFRRIKKRTKEKESALDININL